MGRLIDADVLIKKMCESCSGDACIVDIDHEQCNGCTDTCIFVQMINEQPTAYDVDKVVEQLENKKGIAFLTLANSGQEKNDFAYDEVLSYLDESIEIVKGGK